MFLVNKPNILFNVTINSKMKYPFRGSEDELQNDFTLKLANIYWKKYEW